MTNGLLLHSIHPLTNNLFSDKIPQHGTKDLHKITLETAPTWPLLTDEKYHEANRQNLSYDIPMSLRICMGFLAFHVHKNIWVNYLSMHDESWVSSFCAEDASMYSN